MVLSIIAIVVSLAVLIYEVKLTLVYHRFNEQIKSWAQSLDDAMMDSINQAARNILRGLDEKISEEKNNEQKIIEENVED